MEEQDERVQKFTEKACRVFRECSLVPTVSAARIHAAGNGGARYEVEAKWAQRELERGKKSVFSKSYFIERKAGVVERLWHTAFQADATNILKVAYASESSVKAVLLKDKPAKAECCSEPKQYIEVWNSDILVKTIEVQSLKKHGKVHEDIHFGSFQLSPDGKQLLYVAEKEKPKAVSFFKKTPDKPEEGPPPRKGGEYVFESSWGEQLNSVVDPRPVILNLSSEECVVMETEKMGDLSAGQAQWVPGEEGGVVWVGWENKPRKLGFIYCLNRRGAIYYTDTKTGDCTRLTENTYDVFSPRFSPQGHKLVYFEALAGGPHHTCAALKMINWPTKTISTVVDIVKRPEPGDFPGLYAVFLPERCWDSAGKRIILSDTWGSITEVFCVDVDSGAVNKVTGGGEKGAWSVLDVAHDLVVAQFASPNTAPNLFVGALPDTSNDSISWTKLATMTTSVTEGLTWEVMRFYPPEKDGLWYEAILLKPKQEDSSPLPPLAVAPHGGPHTTFVADFMVWPVCLTALGFAVLLVNYRGSSGFGQDSIFSLPGKVGTQDVNDTQNAAKAVIEKGVVDRERVVVLGGSHGGFLGAHLIGQFPDFYKAASIRNPVIHLPGMTTVSDIPDWVNVEAGLPYDAAKPHTPEELSKMLSVSPIIHAEKIKAPVLIHLGSDDRRVPNSQGKVLYHILKAMGKETKLLLYPGDSHPINSVFSDADSFINGVTWLYKYSL